MRFPLSKALFYIAALVSLPTAMASPVIDVLHEGYVTPIEGQTLLPGADPQNGARRVASTITLIRNGNMILVADPGMSAAGSWQKIIARMAELGVKPEDVTHVFLSHHHMDHNTRVGAFPNATVVDFAFTYKDDLWQDHPDHFEISPGVTVLQTPGHTEEDASLLVETDKGNYLLTHLWWSKDGPAVDPLASSQHALDHHRQEVLEKVDWIIPGHGAPYKNPKRQ